MYNYQFDKPLVYAVKHKNDKIRMDSRSGGFFTSISDFILSEDGVIYGCVLDSDFNAVHIRATSFKERDRMRGSKYIQSNMGDTFKQVRQDLIAGKKVLFSGTSCQVAGLIKYIGGNDPNLFCVDIVCHGVPSPKVFHSYLEWQEKKAKSRCVGFDFRNKKDFGWKAHVETLEFANGERVNSEIFKNIFFSDHCLRPSCYACHYKSTIHPGDITIADYWGIDSAAPDFNDNKGVSLVLVNNNNAKKLFERLTDIEFRECRIEDSMQPALISPCSAPNDRGQFWKDFENRKFSFIAAKYGKNDIIHRSKHTIRRIITSLLSVCGKK